jgi:hypothetical protein
VSKARLFSERERVRKKDFSMTTKCSCQHCNGHIEFDSADFVPGCIAQCPHCGLDTTLFIPAPPVVGQSPKKWRFKIYPTTTIGIIRAIGITGATAFVAYSVCSTAIGLRRGAEAVAGDPAEYIKIRLEAQSEAAVAKAMAEAEHKRWLRDFLGASDSPEMERPDVSFKDANGAYGWHLGDTLPAGFHTNEFSTNAILCFPENSDQEPDYVHGLALELTEDRRIAAIHMDIEGDQIASVYIALKQKYGLRETSGEEFIFGTTNRQVTLFVSSSRLADLEYQDYQLYWLARAQSDIRREAAQKRRTDELKSKL